MKCNLYLDGNEANYRAGLIKRISEQAVIELEIRAENTKRVKYTDEELKLIKTRYK